MASGRREEWAPVLLAGALSQRLRDARGNPKSAKSHATLVGMMFAQFVDEVVVIDAGSFVVRVETPRKAHPSLYGFVPEEYA